MPDEYYTLIAKGARYWFLLLMIIIVLRSIRWYHSDRRSFKLRLKSLPANDFVGQMVLLRCTDLKQVGRLYPVPEEGSIGKALTNDICVHSKTIEHTQVHFQYEEGAGLLVMRTGKGPVWIDGYPLGNDPVPMLDWSILSFGDIQLRMHFNEELHCPSVMQFQALQMQPQSGSGNPVQAQSNEMYGDPSSETRNRRGR